MLFVFQLSMDDYKNGFMGIQKYYALEKKTYFNIT